jgi:hypothetical protein
MRSPAGSVGGLVLTLATLSSCRGEPPPEASGTEMRSSALSEPDIVQDLASAKSGDNADDDRFDVGEAACPLSDAFIPAPLRATWRIYRTKTQESKVTSTPGTVTLSTNGTGFSPAGDSILFFYQATSGDLDTSVTVDPPVPSGAVAGLLLRTGHFPTAPFVFVGVRGGKIIFIRRTSETALVATVGTAAGSTAKVRLVKSGINVIAYSSADGAAWTAVGAAVLHWDRHVEIGVASASESARTLATATFHAFQISFASGCGRCDDED